MSSKFIYSEQIPKEILPAIKETLNKYEFLVPNWMQYVKVSWNGAPPDKGTSAQAVADYSYRWGHIFVCPAFLSESDIERDDTLVHELIHLTLNPLQSFYEHLLKYLDAQPERVQNFMDEQFGEKLETVTVDLADIILKMTKGEDYRKDMPFSDIAPARKDALEPDEIG